MDGVAERRCERRAAGRRRPGHVGVAELEADVVERKAEPLAGQLVHHGSGAGARVARGAADVGLPVPGDGRACLAADLKPAPADGGEAVADLPVAVAHRAYLGVAAYPTEALRPDRVALTQCVARPWQARLGVNLCVVAQAQLERVEAKLIVEFVERGFEREVALCVPWAAHRSWQWNVQAPLPVGGGDVGAGVRARGRAGDRFDARVRDRGAVGRVVLDPDELAVAASAQTDRLHTAGSVADTREHLGAGEDELDWAPYCAGGEDGEDHVLPDDEAGPERAADVGR